MHRQEFNFLGQLFVLILIAGGYAILSLSNPLPHEKALNPIGNPVTQVLNAETPEEVIAAAEQSSRKPASIASSKNISNALRSVVASVDWNCQSLGGEVFKTESLQLRLKGNCKELENLTITNTSNGYTASVFKNENQQYSTDFIQLSKGENLLKIESKNAKGEAIKKQIKVILYENTES